MCRSPKTYLLRQEIGVDKPSDAVRVRSIQRKYHPSLRDAHFFQDPTCNRPSVLGVSMMPSKGLEVTIQQSSRCLAHAVNVKRRCVDPVHSWVQP